MLPFLLSPALLLSALSPAQTATERVRDEVGAPGTVALKGGKTYVGAEKKEIQALVNENPGAAGNLRAYDAETPQNRVKLSPFQLGLTEVTNEQYAPFVRSTGHRPPQEWGEEVINKAALEFLVEVGKKNAELRARGEPTLPTKVDKAKWWSENWRDSEWAIPEGRELYPVVFVDYADVQAYCRWAGVRPMTELEYQHAARGDKKHAYPWGEDWVAGVCSTNEDRAHNETRPVATFEEGRSASGIYELSGNVWEWTASPYVAFENFKKGTYKIERRQESKPEPMWDGNQRVAVGGCYQTSKLVARCTVRRPTERSQMTNALGFRIASSTRTGVDIANAIFETVIRHSEARPSGVSYLPDQPAAMDRWEKTPGSEGAPDGYSIITGYEYGLFVPIEEIVDSNDETFRRLSLVEPLHLGFLTTTFGILEPELGPGTYLIAFRALGETHVEEEGDPDEEIGEETGDDKTEDPKAKRRKRDDPWAATLNIDADNLLFYDAESSELVAHIEVEGFSIGKGPGGGKILPIKKKIWIPDPDDPDELIEIEEDWLQLTYRINSKIRDRGFAITIDLKPED